MVSDVMISGSGKTTLLNVLAHRAATPNATIQQTLCINGTPTSLTTFRKLSSYVEQEDALVGSLTVRETLYFAAQLALPRYVDTSYLTQPLPPVRSVSLADLHGTVPSARRSVRPGSKVSYPHSGYETRQIH